MSAHFAHAMPFGASIGDGGVRFRLWAPGEDAVTLVLEGEDKLSIPMEAAGAGWFELLTNRAQAGSRYRYALGDGTRVADPASRFQPDGVEGPSQVIDPGDYAWKTDDWAGRPWHDVVLYELHLGAFGTAGNYDGLCERLDALCELGVTALELMPLSTFGGRRGWGYDGVLPFAPHPAYGGPDDLKRLIDAAHERGLMMFLDVVYNHFGPEGNYLPRYAPTFFTDRVATPWGDAIDFTHRAVRDFFVHNALYWLTEYRFDGLRFDAVDQIHDPGETHILAEIVATVRRTISDRHVHLVLENDDNAAHYLTREESPSLYTAQWNDDFHHVAHLLATGETNGYYEDYAERPIAKLARALAEGFVYQGEYSSYRERPRGEPSAKLPPLAFVNFLQNHDQIGNRALGERITALAPARRLRALYALLILSPAIPLLFMGEEWAAGTPFLFFCDFSGGLGEAVRKGRRNEFRRFPAFSDPEARERIPDPTDRETFLHSRLRREECDRPEHAEWRDFLAGLLAIRHRELVPRLDALAGGEIESLGEHTFRIVWPAARGKGDGGGWSLVANLGEKPIVTSGGPWRAAWGDAGERLPPWSVRAGAA